MLIVDDEYVEFALLLIAPRIHEKRNQGDLWREIFSEILRDALEFIGAEAASGPHTGIQSSPFVQPSDK